MTLSQFQMRGILWQVLLPYGVAFSWPSGAKDSGTVLIIVLRSKARLSTTGHACALYRLVWPKPSYTAHALSLSTVHILGQPWTAVSSSP